MKIIDQTPFYKENGELGLMDHAKAIMQFGAGWIKEVEAQKAIIAVLGKVLDKRFTLLRNVTPPGLDTMIPLILVGPTGVYVMTVNPLSGLFSARGDQWGVISGGALRQEKPNLLTRTERMARAIQVYLQRQGYSDMNGVEAILLCSDPTTNVDTVRPIIRVVMRDALERFAVIISQARVVLNPEAVFKIIDLLMIPPAPPPPNPSETPAAVAEPLVSLLPITTPPTPETPPVSEVAPAPPPAWVAGSMPPPDASLPAEPPAEPPVEPPVEPFVEPPAEPLSETLVEQPVETPVETPARPLRPLTRKQMVFLLILAVVWLVIVAAFAFLIARDFFPQILMIKSDLPSGCRRSFPSSFLLIMKNYACPAPWGRSLHSWKNSLSSRKSWW